MRMRRERVERRALPLFEKPAWLIRNRQYNGKTESKLKRTALTGTFSAALPA